MNTYDYGKIAKSTGASEVSDHSVNALELQGFEFSSSVKQIVHKIVSQIEGHAEVEKISTTEKQILALGVSKFINHPGENKSDLNYLKAMIDLEKKCSEKRSSVGQYVLSKFSLDAKQFQLGRKYNSGKFQRFGVAFDHKNADPKVYIELNSVYDAKDVDLQRLAPEVASYVNDCHKDGKLVLAILGPARVSGNRGKDILDISASAMERIMSTRGTNLAIMTGGYKGEADGKYGATRAGYDIIKEKSIDSLVIMPRAGEKDSHINVDVKNIVGEMWGDETKALVAAIDAAIVFEPHGLWTEIEVANMKRQGKPYCMINESHDKKIIFDMVDKFNDHPLLTSEELKKKYNSTIPPMQRKRSQRRPSADFDHSQQLWVKPQDFELHRSRGGIEYGR